MQNNENKSWITIDPTTGKVTIHRQLYYEELDKQGLFHVSDKGTIYYYQDGRLQPISIRDFKALVKVPLPVEFRNRHDWETIVEEFKTKLSSFDEDDLDSNESIINFRNGVYDLAKDELLPHSPSFKSTRQLQVEYNPELTISDAPVFQNYMEFLVDGDQETIKFLLEYMGAILSNVKGWRFKKLLLLVGEGNTGKTQLRELIMELVGCENCRSIDMAKINERFGSALLYGKRLAGSGDMAFVELAELNKIKELTGGDMTFGEFKGKDGFSFRYGGFLWFNANRLPYFRGDRGVHVYDRFIIIECPNVVPADKRDSRLLEKLLGEKEAIVNVCIAHLKDAIQRGYRFLETDAMKQMRHEYIKENNSLFTFVQECCGLNEAASEKKSDFRRYYFYWCKNNRVHPERERDIPNLLFEQYGITQHKRSTYQYDGICVNDDVVNDYESSNPGAMKS